MADDHALRAHVLRRLTFGPSLGQLEALAEIAPPDLVSQLLDADPLDVDAPELGSDDDYSRLPQWWLEVMTRPDAGLHEKMTWFWHGHLTSSLDKSSPSLMLRQHRLLREHALGNFRELLQAITVDAAMLYWLDGAGSTIDAPNENYAREVMELFALGRDAGYTEADVRAAARAFAGWWVDGDHDDEVRFDPASGPSSTVALLGREVGSAAEAVDAICDHPACAAHLAATLHTFLVGEVPDDARLADLAASFRASGLDIRSLVEAIVTHPSFLDARLNRPRSAVEWFVAMQHLYDLTIDWWPLDALGQVPFAPPNVAGWAGWARWVSVGAAYGRAQVAGDNAYETPTLDDEDPVADVLRRAGLVEVGDATIAALTEAATSQESRRDRSSLLHALVACCPEFCLA